MRAGGLYYLEAVYGARELRGVDGTEFELEALVRAGRGVVAEAAVGLAEVDAPAVDAHGVERRADYIEMRPALRVLAPERRAGGEVIYRAVLDGEGDLGSALIDGLPRDAGDAVRVRAEHLPRADVGALLDIRLVLEGEELRLVFVRGELKLSP